jgi:hypothetical protein
LTDERIEIQIMKLEDEIVNDLRQLPKWVRVVLYFWMRYVDGGERDELLPLFQRANRD